MNPFTPQLVAQTGSIEKVLGEFLEARLAALQYGLQAVYPELNQGAARRLVGLFATLEGTKRPLKREEVVLPEMDDRQIDWCLEELEKSRILRRIDETYELAHDALAQYINEKRGTRERELLEIENLLRSRYEGHVRTGKTGSWLSEEEVALIHGYVEELKATRRIEGEVWDYHAKSVAEIKRQQRAEIEKLKKDKSRQRTYMGILGVITWIALAGGIATVFLYFSADKQRQKARMTGLLSKASEWLYRDGDNVKALRTAQIAKQLGADPDDPSLISLAATAHGQLDMKPLYSWYRKSEGTATRVKFSPDQRRVLMIAGNRVQEVEVATSEVLATFPHEDFINEIDYGLKGEFILVSGGDQMQRRGYVRIWSRENMDQPVAEIQHPNEVGSFAVAPNGREATSVSFSGDVKIWEIPSGEVTYQSPPGIDVKKVVYSPDGREMALVTDGGLIMIRREGEREFSPLAKAFEGSAQSISFVNEGRDLLVSSFRNVLGVWDKESGLEKWKKEVDGRLHLPQVDPAYNRVFVYDGSAEAEILDTRTGESMATLPVERIRATAAIHFKVDFSPDGQYVAANGYSPFVQVWRTSSGEQVALLEHLEQVNDLQFSDEELKVLTASSDNSVRIWEIDPEIQFQQNLVEAASSPEWFLQIYEESRIEVINMQGGEAVFTYDSERDIKDAVLSPDHDLVFIQENDRISMWQTGDQTRLWELGLNANLADAGFSPDSRFLWIIPRTNLYADPLVVLINAQTGQVHIELPVDYSARQVAFDETTSKVAVSGGIYMNATGNVSIWDLKQENKVAVLPHDHTVDAVEFYDKGTKLVSGSYDGRITIWEDLGGEWTPAGRLPGDATTVEVSKDGQYLLCGDGGNNLLVYDLKTQDQIRALPLGNAPYQTGFLGNKAQVFVVGFDRRLILWDWLSNSVLVKEDLPVLPDQAQLSQNGNFILLRGESDFNQAVFTPAGIISWLNQAPLPQFNREELGIVDLVSEEEYRDL